MQFVGIHQAVEQFAIAVCQFAVDVQEANCFAVGEFGQVLVDFVDDGHHRGFVVPRENRSQDDGGFGGLGLQNF